MMTKPDMINTPPHYTCTDVEPIDAIFAWGFGLSFCLGNAIKYIARHVHKGSAIEDLKKARWYLTKAIDELEKEEEEKRKAQLKIEQIEDCAKSQQHFNPVK